MIKRYSYSLIGEGVDEVFDDDSADLKEFNYGGWVNINNCIIAEQDNMMMGDSWDILNEQIQKQAKNGGPFDVMIIMKEVKE